ncbi:MAG: peptidylprolyl isomerase [Candidatus Eisenbacteria bacterium]
MAEAKSGDKVRVHYTGKLSDGTVFDTSAEGDPLEFTLGKDSVIPGFENAVSGMAPGERKTARIPCDDAYGPRRDELTLEVNRSEFPEGADLNVGQRVRVTQPGGDTFLVTVARVGEADVMLDANHPLAGEDLVFDIELVEIV